MKKFWRRAFFNTYMTAFAFLLLMFIGYILSFALGLWVAPFDPNVSSRVLEIWFYWKGLWARYWLVDTLIITLFLTVLGAIMGFGCTKPQYPNRLIDVLLSVLLIAIATLLAWLHALSITVYSSYGSWLRYPSSDMELIKAISVWLIPLLTGAYCAYGQFSNDKLFPGQ